MGWAIGSLLQRIFFLRGSPKLQCLDPGRMLVFNPVKGSQSSKWPGVVRLPLAIVGGTVSSCS